MRDKIIQSAVDQIKKYGLRRFTIDDIASDLGISKKTVYKYFESKRQIIGAAMDNYLEMEKNGTLEALETGDNWLDKLNALIYCYTQDQIPDGVIEELQRFFPEEWDKTETLSAFKQERVMKLLTEGIEKGNIRLGINPAVIWLTIDKTIKAALDYKFLKENDMTINKAMEEVKSVVLYGILERA